MAKPQERETQSISSAVVSPLVLSPRSARRNIGGGSGSDRATSPGGSALREERARLIRAAKEVAKEIQKSEAQAREQDAVVQIIREELREKAMSPRAARSHSLRAAHDATPAIQRVTSQDPAIQLGLGLSAPGAGRRRSQDATSPPQANPNRSAPPFAGSGHGTGGGFDAQHDADAAGRDPTAQDAQLEVGVQSLLETESQVLLIMQFSVNGTSVMRSDLTRSDLLEVCRNDIDPDRKQTPTRNMSKSTSIGQLAELKRKAPERAHAR